MSQRRTKHTNKKWYAMDLHIHTPGSSDYQQPEVTYLEILQKAEARGLDMIAFTDHNTVAGYRTMMEEVDQFRLLKKLNRILPEEEIRLREYERLLTKITVLPGFEFTATFGFHILGIFSPETPVRDIEHLLLSLNVPPDQLDEGSATIGAAADVLVAYSAINQAGGIAMAAHANSSNGVAMRGFNFGGQTKIAYTQDPNLLALEVTDLENRSRRTTANFFNGTKHEYPRRMHCVQGSDAHRLETDSVRKKNLGIGDRATEVSLAGATFAELRELFKGNDFSRTRPRRSRKGGADFDFITAAREEGPNIIQAFHPVMTVRGGHLYSIISDVAAFANTNGGTLYVGVPANAKEDVVGVTDLEKSTVLLEKEISSRISPPLEVEIDVQKTGGKNILRILIPRGADLPYAVEDSKIYIREEAETSLAVRDEIVNLVRRNTSIGTAQVGVSLPEVLKEAVSLVTAEKTSVTAPEPAKTDEQGSLIPQTGVEVVEVTIRQGTAYYSVRDLRNGNVVKNVTAKSARKLWEYAITEYAKLPRDLKKADMEWQGDFGLIKKYKGGDNQRYDLALQVGKNFRVFFGVSEEGVEDNEDWRKLLGIKDE